MKLEKNESKTKLKSFHLILFSFLLCYIFILNSNYVNEKRAADKMNKEKDALFKAIINKRLLGENSEGVEEGSESSKKVCKLASEDLNKYYRTGDLSSIGLDDDEIECKEKDKDYMKALIALVEKFAGNNETSSSTDELDETDKENITIYVKRIFPLLIFFTFGILSIFGWIVCCFCNCCNCCCCCCCKKVGCKVPCFIFTYIFYALVVISCIIGLSKSNKIFTGLANTECSLLKLLEQVVDGEIKQVTPRWIGISGINNLLGNLRDQIDTLKDTAVDDLETKKGVIDSRKGTFLNDLEQFDSYCYNNGEYLSDYTTTLSTISLPDYKNKKHVLDIIKLVGHKDSVTEEYTNPSFLYALNIEYSEVAERTDGYVETSQASFNDILDSKSEEVVKSLDEAQDTLDELKEPFDDINNDIGETLSDYSEDIDYYGKFIIKLVFSILMIINIALAALLLLICLCSYKACTDCCCCRCLCKCFTHIFWNILALMMILSFIIGSILALVGRIGGDAMSLISYIVGKENFESDNPILLDQLGEAKKYLNICLHGNGSLENEFDLGDSLDSINDIDEVLLGLENATQTFITIRDNLPSFKTFIEQIENRTNYLTSEFGLLGVTDEDSAIILKAMLELLKTETEREGKKEVWDIDGDKTKTCSSGADSFSPGEYKLHPSTCKPIDRDWIQGSGNNNLKDYAKIISEIVDLVEKLKDESDGSFRKNLKNFNGNYYGYINSYIEMLHFLNETIGALIGEIRETVGEGQIFSFLNGKFIGTNMKIILKYLKSSLGEDLYTVGVCLILVGCSLILSISSTILLIIIINVALNQNQVEQQHNRNQVVHFQNNENNNQPRQISVSNH